MAQYRYEIWKIVEDVEPRKPYRIVEHFPVCDGGMRARITDKVYRTLHEAKAEKKRLEETQ